ncbi:ADP-ribosylation factor 9 [Solea senegalensis]|uniref:ADP-ribosylation factor 9 n=1 Tax=Solea senegalensis TaxID=28829 RepID=A0AAV6SL96_SOLSE|nr:ADP-ribosylation factor-like protein 9 [Solea senegalensis]KAG7518178.1 ADP-ribosylation factor 9 [Solea senegalensis]
MVGLRETGFLGASVALAAGVAYLIWNYASSSGQKKTGSRRSGENDTSPTRKEDNRRKKEEEEKRVVEEEEEITEQTAVVTAATAAVTAAPPAEAVTAAPPAPAAAAVTATKEPTRTQSQHVQPRGTQVLVLGLEGAGKSSLLHCLATGSLELDLQPTQGLNAVSINREDMHLELLEIGGKEELRPYWQKYMSRALLLVFVVDSSDAQLFPVAKGHLHELLASDPCLPLMVLANKQDLPGACSITDLHDALSLSEAGDRKIFLIGAHLKKGEAELSSGVQDARELIMQMVCEGR